MKKILTGLLAAATLFVLAPSAIRAQIFTDKYISGGPDANGNYTLTLESFVTGQVTVTESESPADIVLVLDYSVSMNELAGYDRTVDENPITKTGGWTPGDIVNFSDNEGETTQGYFFLHEGNYYPLTKYQNEENASKWAVYFTLPDGRKYLNGSSLSSDASFFSAGSVCWNGALYGCASATSYDKKEGLRRAVMSFIDGLSQKSIATGLHNRLAMVMFNMNTYKQSPSDLRYPHLKEYQEHDYKRGVVLENTILRKDFTDLTDPGQVNSLRNLLTVENIPDPGGNRTFPGAGLSLAHGLFNREVGPAEGADYDHDGSIEEYEKPKNNLGIQYKDRPKVVIIVGDANETGAVSYPWGNFIKDGENTYSSYVNVGSSSVRVDSNNNYGGATVFYVITSPDAERKKNSPLIKQCVGTKVYRDQPETDDPEPGQYIITADQYDAELIDGLNVMSEIIGGADIDLGAEAIVQDVITPEFRHVTGTDIELYTSDCTGVEGGGKLVFSSTETPFAGTVTGPTFNETDKTTTIRVTGFDYSGNWCGDHGGGVYSGKKLIMKLKVKLSDPDNDLVGGLLYTNTEDSVILEGETVVAPFPRPTVWIPIHLQIVKSGLLKDDSAVFAIWRKPVDGTDFETAPYMRVILTGTDGSDVSADITNLDPAYIYKIVETDWSWHYTPGVTERLSTSQTRNPFLFDNTLKTGLPKSAEDVQRNKFF